MKNKTKIFISTKENKLFFVFFARYNSFMIRVFKETNKKLDEFTVENKDFLALHDPNLMPKGSWIHVSNPDEAILSEISKLTSIPLDFLMSSLDEEESARIDKDDDASLIVLDTPFLIDEEKKLYTTAPFIISYNQSYYVTIARHKFELLDEVFKRVKLIEPHKHVRFTLNIIYRLATLFINYLKKLNLKTEEIERTLRTSTKNKEILELMDISKCLIYFSTALNADKAVLIKLLKLKEFNEFEDDYDLMEDTKVELDQASEMCSISRSVLSSMTDAFGSVINNNLNSVMKTLSVITIVLSVPTLISSLYGMNVEDIPLAHHELAFWIVFAISLAFAIIASIILIFLSSGRGRKK